MPVFPMRRARRPLALMVLLILAALSATACSDDPAAEAIEPDLGPAPAFPCDTTAEPQHAYTCAAEPASIRIDDPDGSFEIFEYEASHPLSTATLAFPCAGEQVRVGVGQSRAPQAPTDPCSVAGVRPWHTVPHDQASAACTQIGWRLCSGPELLRACQGPRQYTYTYGGAFEGGKCNVREAFRPAEGESASESPTGEFADCVSDDGVVDANGNLWEWIADGDDGRTYQGAGWRTIAQRHQDSEQACGTVTRLSGVGANTYANEYVGFRCCRDATP
jgi:hypothetical protein